MGIIPVTDQSFKEEVLLAQGPVLVKFWAEWCGPCRDFAPVLDAVADDPEVPVKFTGVDISANAKTPAEYGVRSVPTVAIFKEGKLIDSYSGVLSASALRAWIAKSI